jgi:hypothetical protein
MSRVDAGLVPAAMRRFMAVRLRAMCNFANVGVDRLRSSIQVEYPVIFAGTATLFPRDLRFRKRPDNALIGFAVQRAVDECHWDARRRPQFLGFQHAKSLHPHVVHAA